MSQSDPKFIGTPDYAWHRMELAARRGADRDTVRAHFREWFCGSPFPPTADRDRRDVAALLETCRPEIRCACGHTTVPAGDGWWRGGDGCTSDTNDMHGARGCYDQFGNQLRGNP